MAITATLGRGGWAIQTLNNPTVVERVDRGMFVIAQLGASAPRMNSFALSIRNTIRMRYPMA
jgi:hypothetical protein